MADTEVLFNDLLKEVGIAPADVRLLRHHTGRGIGGRSLHDLWSQDRKAFELYQMTQKADERLFRTGKLWAAFTSPTPGISLFVGLYDAQFEATKIPEWRCPYRGDQPGGGNPVDIFNTQLRPELAEHIGTLTVAWDPSSVRTWKRYAEGASFRAFANSYPTPSLVETLDELRDNLLSFELLRRDPTKNDRASYLGFVQRGHCLLPYTYGEETGFVPSRLVGYKGNTLALHAANSRKDGRETDPAITKILGASYGEDADLERAYKRFCAAHGLRVHTRRRKFWPALQLQDRDRPRALPATHRFEVGKLYTRDDVAELIGLRERRGGKWDTGYARVADEFFVFANVGSKGRTGHDYPNRWEGKQLVWSAKTGTRLGQPEVTELLSGGYPIYLFWRAAERKEFTYAGLAAPVEVEDTSPVRVRWDLDTLSPSPSGVGTAARPPSAHSRRGPPPVAGARTTVYVDGPTSVYLLELEGPIAELFPWLPKGSRVIKIGMSNDPLRRVCDLSCGLPPGCALSWKIVATRLLPSAQEAFEVESLLLERLRVGGFSIGGEFAAVLDSDLAHLAKLQ